MKLTLFSALLFLGLSLAAASAASLPESQKIDSILAKDWQKRNLQANAPASDEVIVRRLYLDIAGRVPTADETAAFMKSNAPDKRAQLIDQLLASDGFTSHMFNYWADVLRLTDNVKGRVTAAAYAEYVKKQVKENTPYDAFVRNLMTTEGGVWDSGAIGFYQRDENKLDHLAYSVQVFLGTSIVCAQCHNHPFDKWSQMDYYGMAAFTYGMDSRGYNANPLKKKNAKMVKGADLAKMTRKERAEAVAKMRAEQKDSESMRQDYAEVRDVMKDVMKPLRYTQVSWDDSKLPALPSDYKYPDAKPGDKIQPKVLFGHEAQFAPGGTRLDAFAQWMTSPENPRFTTVIANRMWKKVFGMALIEPVDEMTDSTVPSNGELMEYLTQLMIDKKYSLKSFLRVLYNSDTYQRSATEQEVDIGGSYYFTGPLLRRMSAEQIWDSMVTLYSGNVDDVISTESKNLHAYLGDLKMLMDTVRDKGPEGLIEAAKKGAADRENNQARLAKLKKEAMSENADPDAKKSLAREANRLRNKTRDGMLEDILGEEGAEGIKRGYKPDYNAGMKVDKATLANMSREERKAALKMGTVANLTERASELISPAKPGHFLRTFGQSDREIIENASDDASVPQALALLNGPVPAALGQPNSALMQKVSAAETPMGQMEQVYLSFFSRLPSSEERATLEQVLKERGELAVQDVIHALASGSQFLYIQ